MNFQIGEQVVHGTYGVGEIVSLDEKEISGQSRLYYVVKVRDLTLWVPANEAGESSLRYPTPAQEFDRLFAILRSPGEPLAPNRQDRKLQLTDLMKDGKADSFCRVLRDLRLYAQTKSLNENDHAILDRAQSFLAAEWAVALAIPLDQARQELRHILGQDQEKPRSARRW